MKDFWEKQAKKGPLCLLAPMDGYGDSAYRQSMKRIAPHTICISEFYSADGLVHSKFLADSVLPHQNMEDPLIIQIFGKDPEMFARAAKIISQDKFNIAGIDVNMGCPAKKVVRSGHGSSLLINEDTAFRIIDALNKATHLPISVKTRLSFDGNQDLIKFGKGLENAGARLLTIHGRTAKQAYTGTADWTNIYELQKHLNIPVVGNGDVINYQDGIQKMQSTHENGKNLAGFMIGRNSFGNPWTFLNSHMDLTQNVGLDKNNFIGDTYYPTLNEMLDAMEFHAEQLVLTKGERKGSLEIRKHLVQYIKSFPGVKQYRKRLVTTESFENSQSVINEIRDVFQKDLKKRPGLDEIEKDDYDM
ncbi:MAG: tRNA-dihydrouridine synthase family protein [Candidatus Gracilibacteria bacterium]|nr:tRNA-dihydrouridine synthase family protein [Candidatus Gracilibacteria bacterium]